MTHRCRSEWRPKARRAFLTPLVLVALCVVSATALGAPTAVPYPNSMAAIGDLLTLDNPLDPNPPDSWSTGTNHAVNSHYLRILAANPAIKGKISNFTGQEIELRRKQGKPSRSAWTT